MTRPCTASNWSGRDSIILVGQMKKKKEWHKKRTINSQGSAVLCQLPLRRTCTIVQRAVLACCDSLFITGIGIPWLMWELEVGVEGEGVERGAIVSVSVKEKE